MDLEYETKYHQLEENYWWFSQRRNFVLQLLRKHKISKDSKILEIGCSGGPLLSKLKSLGFTDVSGIDISENAISVAKSRGLENSSVMDGACLDFPSATFDVVIASDILEHIEDDKKALAEWKRVLKPNGRLLLFVPAHQFLWSEHDKINHHYRRYSKRELLRKVSFSNFSVDNSSYWNGLLFFPVTVLRLLQRFQSKSESKEDQLYKVNNFVNNTLKTILSTEHQILRYINLPFGISLFVEARKN